jgi:hypothetical protein
VIPVPVKIEDLIKFVEKFGNKIEGVIFNGEIIRFINGVEFYLDQKCYLSDTRSSLYSKGNVNSKDKDIPDNTKVVLFIEDSVSKLQHKLTMSKLSKQSDFSLRAILKNVGDVIKIDGREYVINSSIDFRDVYKIEPDPEKK